MLSAVVLISALAQAPSLKDARSIAEEIYLGGSRLAWNTAAPSLRKSVQSEAGMRRLIGQIRAPLGSEVRLITETLVEKNGGTLYRRVSAVSNWARGMELELSFNSAGQLAAMVTRAASKDAPTVSARHKTQTSLRLPFDGSWFVLWGGRTFGENRHTPVPDMRYAMDLFVVDGATSYVRQGRTNLDYYAWDQPILAPGDGRVVAAVRNVPDNLPNRPKTGSLFGNYVVIDHENGEFSLLGHLQQNSVAVRMGDRVVAGQEIARCGNSGMSTEPHLHYQLMDHADWKKAHGLPAQFNKYVANGRFVEVGEPMRAQVISHAAIEARRDQ